MSKADGELRLPAQSPFVAVLRMTTAGLAARLDFTLDDIEDLRIAVGEASALLLEHASETSTLTTRFDLGEGRIGLSVGIDQTTSESPEVDRDSFAWQVLQALVDDVRSDGADHACTISFGATSAKV